MTQRLSATLAAETAQPVVRPVLMALFDFAGGAVRAWSGVGDLVWEGQTWVGVGSFGAVGPIEETTEVRATGARFQLSGVPSGLLNEVVGVSVQGRRARLWLAFMAEDWGGFIEAPVLLFDGRMDMVEVTDGGRIATIALAAENRLGAALVEGATRAAGRPVPGEVCGPSNIGNYLADRGIPATCGFGVTCEGVHGADERIEIASIPLVWDAYGHAIRRLMGRA